MLDVHSKLSWRLHLIARALEINQLPTTRVAYMASEDEWQSLVKDVAEQAKYPGIAAINLDDCVDITYRGITVLKPKTL
jgi:hypothetical protein